MLSITTLYFRKKSTEDEFPIVEKFWVKNGCDLLALLNERGESS